MKRAIIWVLTFAPILVSAQTDTLNTLEKLYPKPHKVTEIKHNGWRDGVIDTLLPSIGSFEKLSILWLSDHGLYAVPKEIGNCKKLQKLSFAGNNLTSLPEEIYTLKYLREIVLLDNKFTEDQIEEIKMRFAKELPNCRVVI